MGWQVSQHFWETAVFVAVFAFAQVLSQALPPINPTTGLSFIVILSKTFFRKRKKNGTPRRGVLSTLSICSLNISWTAWKPLLCWFGDICSSLSFWPVRCVSPASKSASRDVLIDKQSPGHPASCMSHGTLMDKGGKLNSCMLRAGFCCLELGNANSWAGGRGQRKHLNRHTRLWSCFPSWRPSLLSSFPFGRSFLEKTNTHQEKKTIF